MNTIEQSKKLAAYNAVDHHVKPEHKVSSSILGTIVFKACFRSLESVLVRVVYCCGAHYVLSLWQGSTVPYVVERIIQQGLEANKDRVFISSGTQLSPITGVIQTLKSFIGFQSKQLIVEGGLRLGDVDEHPTIDVTLDGADE